MTTRIFLDFYSVLVQYDYVCFALHLPFCQAFQRVQGIPQAHVVPDMKACMLKSEAFLYFSAFLISDHPESIILKQGNCNKSAFKCQKNYLLGLMQYYKSLRKYTLVSFKNTQFQLVFRQGLLKFSCTEIHFKNTICHSDISYLRTSLSRLSLQSRDTRRTL